MKPNPQKKKVDYAALESPLMRLPGMKVDMVRGLMDAGIGESYELSGRAWESLCQEVFVKHPELRKVPDFGARVALAIYVAETDDLEPDKLRLSYWLDRIPALPAP